MKRIEDLPEDIYKLFSEGHECSEENLTALGKDIIESVKGALTKKDTHHNRGGLRMSNLGTPHCKLWFEKEGYEAESIPPWKLFSFMYGHVIEALVIFLAKEAGHEVTDVQRKVEVDGVEGTMDCTIDGEVVDVKSASTYGFKKFKDDQLVFDDPFGYIPQISGYVNARGKEQGYFLAIDKQHGHITTTKISSDELADVDGLIRGARAVLRSDSDRPERCYSDVADGKSGNRKLCVNCSYCSYKQSCWDGLRKFIYSNGPRYLSLVVKEPKVTEVDFDGNIINKD